MSWLNVNDRKLRRQIRKAEKAHEQYVNAVECLKNTYYEIYDKDAVEMLIEVVNENGHPSHRSKINEFSDKYKSEQIDEVDIKTFKRFLNNYNDEFLEKRNKKGE